MYAKLVFQKIIYQFMTVRFDQKTIFDKDPGEGVPRIRLPVSQ
jgi:hypothetical protein